MREKIDVLFCLLERIHWPRVIHLSLSDKLFCAHTSIYIHVAPHFFWAVLFLNDSYKSARVIDNASQDLHAFLQKKIYSLPLFEFSHCPTFIYIQHVCVSST